MMTGPFIKMVSLAIYALIPKYLCTTNERFHIDQSLQH